MNDDKVRIRSKEELDSRKKCFLEIVDILEENKINFFIQAGTVLGAKRENNFIKWDWDVEFGIFEDEFINNYELIKSEMLKKNFKIFHEIKNRKDGKIDAWKDFGAKTTLYEILCWSYDSQQDRFFRWNINIPAKFFKEKNTIKFFGKELQCPGPVEEYLTYQYGDWQTPKRVSKKKDYLTSKFYNERKNNFYVRIKKKLFNLLNKI
jgi:phosphorylcholine metabolism protein LicD